jgi:hypothetical protein
MNNLTTAFFEIVKADKNADGTLMVYGKATDDSIDMDQQICDSTWLDSAMPEWFKSGGNIREQHSSIAAGVAKEYERKKDGHYIHALVVDPASVKKVDLGVLKGFSIGIKNPRITRDEKAANGRIVDGTIVEVSLVDRPANPNCQLVLAKSIDGETGVWKVEELIEKEDAVDTTPATETPELVEEVLPEAEVVAEETPISEIVEEDKLEQLGIEKTAKAKSILASLVKFDKGQYEAAREALASLIAVEAEEMKGGSNEIMSISHLLEAVAHLAMWYEGEEAEGEVEEMIEMSAKAEEPMEDGKPVRKEGESDEAYKKRCKMYDEKMKNKEVDPVPTEDTGANLEGTTNIAAGETAGVPFQATVTDSQARINGAKSVSADEAEVSALVEQVVKSATESLKSEIAELVAAKEAALTKAVSLEEELATAKSLAIAGGPKRTGTSLGQPNDLIVKAATYKAKANATTDPLLAKGYKALADEYFAKAEDLNK